MNPRKTGALPVSEIYTELRAEEGHNVERSDTVLAMNAANLLNKHYPGHLWAVNVNSEGGVMIIKNLAISSMYGIVLHLKNVYQDPTLKLVVQGGGELLERAHMRRGKATGDVAKVVEGAMKHHQPRDGILF